MKRTAAFLVDRRKAVFLTMMLLVLVSIILIPRVNVNTDMTKYLPDSSAMKQGVDIMAKEFSGMSMPNTIRVMFRDVPGQEKEKILGGLKMTPHVDSVSFVPGDGRYEKDGFSLYVLSFSVDYESDEMNEAQDYIRSNYDGYCGMVFCLDKPKQQGVPVWIFVLALVLLVVILQIFSPSWLEPFLFLSAMGAAVVINMGSNILLSYVSQITWSIGAILQLALSIDYSVILMSRYRQELALLSGSRSDHVPEHDADKVPEAAEGSNEERAMKAALEKSFSSIAGSSFTTIVGFLVLIFMSFKIGRDMGIVMAKGVFLSMFCILTILPFLVLSADKLIRKTRKRVLTIKMGAVSRFSYRHRKIITVLFVLFFLAVFVLKGSCGIAFTLIESNDIDRVFPSENQIVLLYENSDEDAAADMVGVLEEEDGVNSVIAWSNTLGGSYTASELEDMMGSLGGSAGFDIPPEMIRMVYRLYFAGKEEGKLSIGELADYVSGTLSDNIILKALVPDEMKDRLKDAPALLEEAGKQIKGPEHSLMVLSTSLPLESEETSAFMERLRALCEQNLSGKWYLIGNTPMAVEMVKTFSGELNFLTLLTAGVIFLVVLVTFRSLAVPVILVLLIQSAVYTTMVLINIQGMTIYYLALLVVQSILMGATIDYAILLTNYYREMRRQKEPGPALQDAYGLSVHTILTSGCIVVSVTAIVGFAFSDPSVCQIVHTISKGAACALILILFVLPGLLSALDFLVVGRKKQSIIGNRGEHP